MMPNFLAFVVYYVQVWSCKIVASLWFNFAHWTKPLLRSRDSDFVKLVWFTTSYFCKFDPHLCLATTHVQVTFTHDRSVSSLQYIIITPSAMASLWQYLPKGKESVVDRFNEDIESLTVLGWKYTCLLPVICCVCDSIPKRRQWSTKCDVTEPRNVAICNVQFFGRNLSSHPNVQYSWITPELETFVLPATVNKDEAIICKDCHELNGS
jgi:hypothetical protein